MGENGREAGPSKKLSSFVKKKKKKKRVQYVLNIYLYIYTKYNKMGTTSLVVKKACDALQVLLYS